MKKRALLLALLILLLLSAVNGRSDDLDRAGEEVVSRLAENPVAIEVFSLDGYFEAVET
ncbi:MAG: hypothetical protein IJP16_08515 [Clostridia bacterium]|nr:hypothetical protein [Clostridia bacterium]